MCSGCVGGAARRSRSDPARIATQVEAALASGDVSMAEQLLVVGLARWPGDPGLGAWSAVLHGLRGDREREIDELRALPRHLSADDPERAALSARVGIELFRAGRYGEAGPWLRAAGGSDPTLAGLAVVTDDLPVFQRRLGGRAVAELPLVEESPPVLECSVEGSTARMVVDTGASMTTISRQLAERIGLLVPPPYVEARDGTGAPIPAAIGVVPTLRLGALELGPVPVLVLDADRLDLRSGESDGVDGLIGFDLLSRLRFTFDPERRSLVLGAPRGTTGSDLAVHCLHEQGCVLAPVRIQRREFWFLLDSGASSSSLTPTGYDALVEGRGPGELTHRSVHGPGGERLAVVEVPEVSLEVAGARFSGLTLPVIRRSPEPGSLLPVHGVLGGDLLLRCRTTYDSGALRIAAPRGAAPRNSP